MLGAGSGEGARCRGALLPPPGHVPLVLGGDGATVTMVGGKEEEGRGPRQQPELELEADPGLELEPEHELLAKRPVSCWTSEYVTLVPEFSGEL